MSESYILSLVLCGIILVMLVVFFGYNLKVSKNQIQLKKAVKEVKKSDETQNEKLENQSKELWEMRVKLERDAETLQNTCLLQEKLLSNANEEKKSYLNEVIKLKDWVITKCEINFRFLISLIPIQIFLSPLPKSL